MAVIEGPGGPIAASSTRSMDEHALSGLVAHSPQAARIVLEELTARLREQDLAKVTRWSADVDDQLLD